MTTDNEKLLTNIEKQNSPVRPAFENTVARWCKENMKRLTNLSGSQAEANKILLLSLNQINRSPQLMDAANQDFESFAKAVMVACELKLYPGVLGECAFVPMNNKYTGKKEIQFWPMYQGLLKLAYNTGVIEAVSTGVAYENDEFDFEMGSNPYVRHKMFLRGERGERIAAYAVVKLKNGGSVVGVVPMSFIEAIKKRSPGAKSSSSPWSGSADDYDAMARKTVLKQVLKLVPKSVELARGLEISDAEDYEKDIVVKPISPEITKMEDALLGLDNEAK